MKITNDQLKNYVGHRLKLNASRYPSYHLLVPAEMLSVGVEEVLLKFKRDSRIYTKFDKRFKPICYRMKDLATYIPELGFIPAVELAKLITQAGWQGEVSEVKHENDTITVKFVHQGDTILNIIRQHCFEIDIDEDFGFGIYKVEWPADDPFSWTETERSTGNIWKMYQKLFEWHFWPFGEEYFEKGLVIDKLNQ